MSEETAQKLAQAKQAHAEQHSKVQALIQQTLDDVASKFGERIEAYAKKLAHDQPNVTKRLGRDGIDALRTDLASSADGLVERFRSSGGQMRWPTGKGRTNGAALAMIGYLDGHTPKIDRVLSSHGYDVRNGLSGWNLVGSNSQFGELELQLDALARFAREVEAAQAADDRDTVDDLWN